MSGDILSKLFSQIPPDQGDFQKTAGQSALTDQIQGFLDMFKGAENNTESVEEQAEEKAKKKKEEARGAATTSGKGTQSEIPPEFLAQQESEDKKKEEGSEKEASLSPGAVRQAIDFLVQNQLQSSSVKLAEDQKRTKLAAAAELSQTNWGGKVKAAAAADELAKIAYYEAVGVPFEAYLKMAQGADPAAAMAAAAPSGPPPGGPQGPPPGPPPGPPAEGPPGPGPGGGPPVDPNAVLEDLMALPPEVQAQILAAVSGGGGGGQ
jgi:hypothetical protein